MLEKENGFTLIELLIIIGIIGFLAAAILVAVDPVKRIQDARDARNSSNRDATVGSVLIKPVDDTAIQKIVPTTPSTEAKVKSTP